MAAPVVYEGVPNTHGGMGTLFQGQKFWFSATVPQRHWLIENVKANGGEVVQLEKQADVLLVDHKRKNPAPGAHSYKYVEYSIRKGMLENLADHRVGLTSRADRPVGSVTLTPKGARNPYTEADDQFLWDWVKPLEEAGGATAGNSIYQQLEAANPRHTFQSWRDRWLKYVRHQNRQVTVPVHEEKGPQSTPGRKLVQARASDGVEEFPVRSRVSAGLRASAQDERQPWHESVKAVPPPRSRSSDRAATGTALPTLESKGKAHSRRNTRYEKSGNQVFTDDEYDELFAAAPYILVTPTDCLSTAWRKQARQKEKDAKEEPEKVKEENKMPKRIIVHSAEEWRAYFEMVVGPDYDEQLEQETGRQRKNSSAKGQPTQASVKIEGSTAQSRKKVPQESQTHRIDRTSSLSPQPRSRILSTPRFESPTVSFVTTQDRTPGPNEARKRRTGKGTNSQESTTSTAKDADSIEELSRKSEQSHKRKWNVGSDDEGENSPSLPPFGNQEQAKRRRKPDELPKSLEIPSTPDPYAARRLESSAEERASSQELGSPTPRPRRSCHKRSDRGDISYPPLFVLQNHTSSNRVGSDESDKDQASPLIVGQEDEILLSTPGRRENVDPDTQTSPLSVHLVSDYDPPPPSSFSHAQSDSEQDSGSPTPEFETAPEFSQIWETAHEEAEAGTARLDVQRMQDRTIAETQPEDDFTLPEPEGGWDDLPLPPEADAAETGEAAKVEYLQNEDGAASKADEPIEGWVAAHLEADPDADDELLLTAAGMADLDFQLADVVYQSLVQGKPVPENMKGVWTERDDAALRGSDAKEIKRIEEKHGQDRLEGRWHWLENQQKWTDLEQVSRSQTLSAT